MPFRAKPQRRKGYAMEKKLVSNGDNGISRLQTKILLRYRCGFA
jgi:hypothetical protein